MTPPLKRLAPPRNQHHPPDQAQPVLQSQGRLQEQQQVRGSHLDAAGSGTISAATGRVMARDASAHCVGPHVPAMTSAFAFNCLFSMPDVKTVAVPGGHVLPKQRA